MPHPKRKISTTRRDKRRTHDKAPVPQISLCSNCGTPVLYHRVCSDCGYYRGKQAVVKATAE